MTEVTLNNSIITRTIGANTTFTVPDEVNVLTPTSGPVQPDYSESYEAFNKNLGTNGFAFAADVGVIDLSDLSLVTETNFSQTPAENTVFTDTGLLVNARMTSPGPNSFKEITFEHYDLSQTNPAKQTNSFSDLGLEPNDQKIDRIENLGYARPSGSSVILKHFTRATGEVTSSGETRILMFDFLTGSNARLHPNHNTSGAADMRFAKREGGWSYGIDDGSSLNIIGGTGFIDLSAGDSLDFQKSQSSSGIIGAYDYGAIFTEGSQLQAQDISPAGITGTDLIILWQGPEVDVTDNQVPAARNYRYINADGEDAWVDGINYINPVEHEYKTEKLFETGTATSAPGIAGIHTFSDRSAKRLSESDINPTSPESKFKLRINEATGSSVKINGATVTDSSGGFNRVETFVSAGDSITTGASKTHISLIQVS